MNIKILLVLSLCLISNNIAFASEPVRQKILSVAQRHIKSFEKIQESFEAKRFDELYEMLDELSKKELNTVERAYVNNYYGNAYFIKKEYQRAIDSFEKTIEVERGISPNFIKQIKDNVLPRLKLKLEEHTNDYARLKGLLKENPNIPLDDNHLTLVEALRWFGKSDDVTQIMQRAENQFGEASLPEKWFEMKVDILVDAEANIDKKIELRKMQVEKFPSRSNWYELLALYRQQNRSNKSAGPFAKPEADQRIGEVFRAMYKSKLLQEGDEYLIYIRYLHKGEEFDELIDVYSAAYAEGLIKPNKNDIKMYGSVLFKKGMWEQAIIENRKLIDLGAYDAGGHWIIVGRANQELNQFDEARIAFKEARSYSKYKKEAKQRLKALRKLERQARKDKNKQKN